MNRFNYKKSEFILDLKTHDCCHLRKKTKHNSVKCTFFFVQFFFSGFLLCVCVSTSARIQCWRTLCKALGNAQLARGLHTRRPTMSPKKRLGRGHRKSLACAHWTHGVAHCSSHPKVEDRAHNNPQRCCPPWKGISPRRLRQQLLFRPWTYSTHPARREAFMKML